MAFERERILAWPVPTVRQRLDTRDAMLYALAIGFGHEPADERQLAYVYEPDLMVAPTMATVLAHPGFWMRDSATGIDWERVVHGEQGFRIHRPLRLGSHLVGTTKVTHVADKGHDTGALVYQERTVVDGVTGDLLATLTMTTFCRGDGGCGGPSHGVGTPLQPVPPRSPAWTCDLPTLPQGALLFRLLGDTNPLHADPATARRAGFERPILHGLCTFGVVGHAIVRTLCDYDPTRLVAMRARFAAPVYPGETLRSEFWPEADTGTVRFRARSLERDLVVLDRGLASIDAATHDGAR